MTAKTATHHVASDHAYEVPSDAHTPKPGQQRATKLIKRFAVGVALLVGASAFTSSSPASALVKDNIITNTSTVCALKGSVLYDGAGVSRVRFSSYHNVKGWRYGTWGPFMRSWTGDPVLDFAPVHTGRGSYAILAEFYYYNIATGSWKVASEWVVNEAGGYWCTQR